MQNVPISGETRKIGAPSNWDAEKMGECMTISVCDQMTDIGNVMVTAWKLTEDEMSALKNGGHLIIGVYGTSHPVVSLGVAKEDGDYAVG